MDSLTLDGQVARKFKERSPVTDPPRAGFILLGTWRPCLKVAQPDPIEAPEIDATAGQ